MNAGHTICYLTIMIAGFLLAWASICNAQLYNVAIDTSSLDGLGTYYVEFQVTAGSAPFGDSQATISNFNLTGGTLGAILPPTQGNVAGSLPGTLILTDGPAIFGPIADFAQAFSVTNTTSNLSFGLQLAASTVNTPIPDGFTFMILDGSQVPLPTTGPTGVEFVSADFTSTTPIPQVYGTASNSPVIIPTPNLTTSTAVPESNAICLLGSLSLSIIRLLIRRRDILKQR